MTLYAYNRHLGCELPVLATFNRKDGQHCVYGDVIPAFADVLRRRIEDDRQNVIVVAGDTGSGKSTFALHMCYEMGGKRWDLRSNYIYDVNDLKTKLDRSKPSPISLFDEGSISLNSNNSMKGDDKMLVALFDTMRSRHWTTFICIPKIEMLNKRIREVHVDYVCRCPIQPVISGYESRGFIQIYKHIRREWGEDYDKLIATGIYPPLDDKTQRLYAAVKASAQARLIDQFVAAEG